MIGYRPGPYIKYCWLFLTPATCIGTFAFSLIKYTPLKYNNEYVYPLWGYVIGWLLALSSMICIPLWMLYKLSTTEGTLRERIQLLITPCDSLPKTKREQERSLAIFAPEVEPSLNRNGYYPVSEKDSNLWGSSNDVYEKDLVFFLVPLLTCCTLTPSQRQQAGETTKCHIICKKDKRYSGDKGHTVCWVLPHVHFRDGSKVIREEI